MPAILRSGPWKLADLKKVPKNGFTVFSCFHCGGGSTMGYKLAGYDVLGGVEIDPQMMDIYRRNHSPKHSFLMGVKEFAQISNEDLPSELFSLDILDGSPPCSSFSTAGARDKKWGKASKFREGQAVQVLDDLFFDFIEVAAKLSPKIVIAENVKGLIVGKAKGYVKQIFAHFASAGYEAQLFLFNASRMGVPQKRERTFFLARKKSLNLAPINIEFNEPIIPFSAIKQVGAAADLTPRVKKLWDKRRPGDLHIGFINERLTGKNSGFTTMIQQDHEPCYTITASDGNILYSEPRHLTDRERILAQTFPDDFDFGALSPTYICGMSVPPFMMQRVADQIERQWLNA